MVTVFELFCGLAKAQDPANERLKVERFVSAIIELPLDRASAEAAANIRTALERQGTRIGPYDLLIAGQAIVGNLILNSQAMTLQCDAETHETLEEALFAHVGKGPDVS